MNYCVGLIFTLDLTRIILIKKNRGPDCVKDKLNAIGGKIETNESGEEAIIRECKEETGLEINNWTYFSRLECDEGIIYFYYAILDNRSFYSYESITDEKVGDYSVFGEYNQIDETIENYKIFPHVANLDWNIIMAINHYKKLDRTKSFIVKEVNN